ncbi:MAG: response regulator transcription factor [Acidobacteriota bacterium]|nr:response regulator transcription factor [Acidobacteriota bacterium]
MENDEVVANTVRLYLEQAGFEVERCRDGVSAVARALDAALPPIALVVLDLMIPRLPGQDVCARIRRASRVPILMLTARTSEDDRIRGLELGADDYVGKPFSPREIVLRVQALLRRSGSGGAEPEPVRVGTLAIDSWKREARAEGVPVALTATEFRLLEALARHPGRAFTREELLARAFGPDSDALDRTVDVHITNMRRKLELRGASRYLVTVHGIGYRLSEAGE